jgi:DNA invertase Pin-like site-specific DNA recombinase
MAFPRREQPVTIYGYARVSTDGQTLDAQQAELTAASCTKIFAEIPAREAIGASSPSS